MEAQETLKAQRFELVDQEGRAKAALETGNAGEPILRLADSEGRPRIDLRVTDAGTPSLALADSKGNPRMSLTMSKEDIPAFGFHGPAGESTILLAIHPDGTPTISLSDKAGEVTVNATVMTSADGSTLVLSTRDGTPRVAAKLDSQGQTQLGLFDEAGQLSWASRQSPGQPPVEQADTEAEEAGTEEGPSAEKGVAASEEQGPEASSEEAVSPAGEQRASQEAKAPSENPRPDAGQ